MFHSHSLSIFAQLMAAILLLLLVNLSHGKPLPSSHKAGSLLSVEGYLDNCVAYKNIGHIALAIQELENVEPRKESVETLLTILKKAETSGTTTNLHEATAMFAPMKEFNNLLFEIKHKFGSVGYFANENKDNEKLMKEGIKLFEKNENALLAKARENGYDNLTAALIQLGKEIEELKNSTLIPGRNYHYVPGSGCKECNKIEQLATKAVEVGLRYLFGLYEQSGSLVNVEGYLDNCVAYKNIGHIALAIQELENVEPRKESVETLLTILKKAENSGTTTNLHEATAMFAPMKEFNNLLFEIKHKFGSVGYFENEDKDNEKLMKDGIKLFEENQDALMAKAQQSGYDHMVVTLTQLGKAIAELKNTTLIPGRSHHYVPGSGCKECNKIEQLATKAVEVGLRHLFGLYA